MSSEVESNSEELSFMIILPKIQEIVWDKDALLEDTCHDESLDSNKSSYLKMSCTTTSNNSFTNLLEKFDLRAPEEVVEKVHTKMFGDVLPIMDEDMFFLHGSSSEVIISCSTCCLVGLIRATWICASFNSIQVIISCSTCTDPYCPNRSKKAASSAADDDLYRVKTCTDPCSPNRFKKAATTAAADDLYRVETCTDPCGPSWSKEAASTAADDDLHRVKTCTDSFCPNRSKKAASTAADDDLYRDKTCTDPCCPNWSKEAASTAADDDIILDRIVLMNFFEITCMARICRN